MTETLTPQVIARGHEPEVGGDVSHGFRPRCWHTQSVV